MSFKAILYAYILGGVTFIPLLLCGFIYFTIYTSVPVGDPDIQKKSRSKLALEGVEETSQDPSSTSPTSSDVNDIPKTRKGWLTVRRTFEESAFDGGYVTLVRSFLDARSKDPKRSRPKDMWYVVLKGKILYLYEDEEMTECEAAIQLGSHDVVIYPEGQLDGELFTKRNGICLKPKSKTARGEDKIMPSVSKEMKLGDTEPDAVANVEGRSSAVAQKKREKEAEVELEKKRLAAARDEALEPSTPWFIFVRSTVEMEDWYLAMIHASDHPAQTPYLSPLRPIFLPSDMNLLVSTLDEQPDIIPMRWLNAILGRIFYSFYRAENLESFIIGRLMKKISKVKRPAFLADVAVTEVSVGNRTPVFSKPMLKELTKEGDASMEVHVHYKGEVRIRVEATVIINLGARFKSYTVTVALAAILKEIEGNMLIKIKRPPSNRFWYAFTQMPKMDLEVEPIVSDRQITWGMILSTIESKIKEILQESVVMPNMDDISFFESADREHRGGIWADSARKPRTAYQPKDAPLGEQPLVEDSTRQESASIAEGQVKSDAESSFSPPAGKSNSVSQLPASSEPLSMRVSSTSVSSSPEDSGTINKRKAWFSGMRGVDVTSMNDESDAATETTERGRVSEAEAITHPRSRSTPGVAEALNGDRDVDSDVSPQRRSPSRHSTTRGEKFPSTSEDPSSSLTEPSSASASRTSSFSSPPTSPSSFLQAFKNKTADKQALTNQAKEAMKKWGVNWSNLRKDSGSTTGSTGSEDLPDHGSVGSGSSSLQRTASNSSNGSKARASYAEVRAAVAERRGRQEVESGLTTSRPLHSSRTPSPSSSSRVRTVSTEASSSSAPITPHRRLSSATSFPYNGIEPRSPPTQAPSLSRAPTLNGQSDDRDRTTSASPIHVQPQAKTMSIPGIHVSHRGEVMSMGYVPPQPPKESSGSFSSSSPEGKSKVLNSLGGTAGIQSMYRLFSKNSGQSGPSPSALSQNDDEPQTHSSTTTEESYRSTPPPPTMFPEPPTAARTKTPPPLPPRNPSMIPESSLYSASNSTTSSPIPSASSISPPMVTTRQPPPPLPPRSSPVRTRPPIEPSRPSSETTAELASVSASLTSDDRSASPASEKLKSIAKRASLSMKGKDKVDVLPHDTSGSAEGEVTA